MTAWNASRWTCPLPVPFGCPAGGFPGSGAGHSLSVLHSDVAKTRATCARGNAGAALECAELLLTALDEILAGYADPLTRHGMKRPDATAPARGGGARVLPAAAPAPRGALVAEGPRHTPGNAVEGPRTPALS
ncbi:DUF6959 family protein [Peterkaempfera griseoplana]|uniref:DUF6959 family protein n=1 Tax=Peterkaempfera griseoplana TaxID=66896 RepID=UPI00389A4A7B